MLNHIIRQNLTSKTESVLKLVLNNRTLAHSLFDSKIKSFFMFFFIGVVLWVAKWYGKHTEF